MSNLFAQIIAQKKGTPSPLPSGYTECVYLESSTTQYIDTGYKPNERTIVKALVYCIQGGAFMGIRNANANDNNMCITNTPTTLYADIGRNYTLTRSRTVPFDRLDFHSIEVSSSGIGCDDNFTAYPALGVWQSVGDFAIFGAYNNGVILIINQQLSSFTLMEGEETIINFIPCLDTNGRPCMFDTVSQQPFYNNGTGEFGYETKNGEYVAPV